MSLGHAKFVGALKYLDAEGALDRSILISSASLRIMGLRVVGMVVTMLNLVPSGMFDGGHVARSLMGDKMHKIVSYAGIALLAVVWWPMAILAIFFSANKHPGPLDDVSKLTTRRKIGAVLLVIVFILSVVPMELAV